MRIVYIEPNGEMFRKGTRVFLESAKGLISLPVSDWEVGQVGKDLYLLVDRQREEYIGHGLSKSNGDLWYYRTESGEIVARDSEGRVIESSEKWIRKGVRAMEGLIVEVGEEIVVVEDGLGRRRSMYKDRLRKWQDPTEDARKSLEAYLYLRELKKAIEGQGSSEEAKTPEVRWTPKLHGLKWSIEGPAEKQATEGQTRQFGPKDLRRLIRTVSGKLRWMNADEEQKMKEAEGKRTEKKEREFRIGEKIWLPRRLLSSLVGLVVKRGERQRREIAEFRKSLLERRNVNGVGVSWKEPKFQKKEEPLAQTDLGSEKYAELIDSLGRHSVTELEKIQEKIPRSTVEAITAKDTIERYKVEGEWDKERKALHRDFIHAKIGEVKEDVPEGTREAIIFAGGTAVGKTTVLAALFGMKLQKGEYVWVDPDDAKAMLPEYNILVAKRDFAAAPTTHEESSEMNYNVIDEAIKKRQNMVIDKTLSDPAKAERLWKTLKEGGYRITLILTDADVDVATDRAMLRANRTARLPRPEFIREGNLGAVKSFWKLVKQAEDTDRIFALRNNGRKTEPPILVYHRVGMKDFIDEESEFKKLITKGGADGRDFGYTRPIERDAKDATGGMEKTSGSIGQGRGEKARGLFPTWGKVLRGNTGRTIRGVEKSLRAFLEKAFGEQMALFGATEKKPSAQGTITGLSWKKLGLEKPQHKYIRRYRGKSGEWEYVYREPKTGKEYVGDEKGQPLPRHRDWKEGDRVHVGDKDASIVHVGDTVVVLKDENGQNFTARMKDIETFEERQRRLRRETEKTPSKWQSLVDELEADLEEGKKTGEYEMGDDRGEVMRKLKYAKEELERRKEKQSELKVVEDVHKFDAVKPKKGSGKQPAKITPQPEGGVQSVRALKPTEPPVAEAEGGVTEARPAEPRPAIPDFRSTEEAEAFGRQADEATLSELQRLRRETLNEFERLRARGRAIGPAAQRLALRGQYYREAFEAGRPKEGHSHD